MEEQPRCWEEQEGLFYDCIRTKGRLRDQGARGGTDRWSGFSRLFFFGSRRARPFPLWANVPRFGGTGSLGTFGHNWWTKNYFYDLPFGGAAPVSARVESPASANFWPVCGTRGMFYRIRMESLARHHHDHLWSGSRFWTVAQLQARFTNRESPTLASSRHLHGRGQGGLPELLAIASLLRHLPHNFVGDILTVDMPTGRAKNPRNLREVAAGN